MEFEEKRDQAASQQIEKKSDLHNNPAWKSNTVLFLLTCYISVNWPWDDSNVFKCHGDKDPVSADEYIDQ